METSIVIEIQIPKKDYYTWVITTSSLFIETLFDPAGPSEDSKEEIHIFKIIIPLDKINISAFEYLHDIKFLDEKSLKNTLIQRYETCNARIKSIMIPNFF